MRISPLLKNWKQSFHAVMMTESGEELKLVGG